MDASATIRVLFASAPHDGLVEVRRVPAKGTPAQFVDPHEPVLPADSELSEGNWFFGTVLRTPTRELHSATLVWADLDSKTAEPPDPAKVFPRPNVAINSGSGTHLYWVLAQPVDPLKAVYLSTLAALAFSGDRKVLEAHRVMRLPGSFNQKYDPPKPCVTTYTPGTPTWDLDELESALVAAVAAKYWSGGERHALALGLSATLARAGWDVDKMQSTLSMVCDFANDEEKSDRRTCAWSTFQRHSAGTLVSAKDWREALGDEDFKLFLKGLGVTQRDGHLVYMGETIGSVSFLEKDLVAGFLGLDSWAYAEGGVFEWHSPVWQARDEAALKTAVFNFISQVAYIDNGEERAMVPTNKLASAVASIVKGHLTAHVLPDPDPNLLPCRNGVLDLHTLELRATKKEDYFRWTIGADYEPSATCLQWEAFLQSSAPEEYDYLQEWLGYCLTPGNPWQRMLWLYGASGTGKSTFLNVVSALFGPAAVSVRPDNLSDYALAALGQARLATCSEISDRTLRTPMLKALIASDKVTARHPYGRPFDLTFNGKFTWASNILPPVDQAEGMWRRLGVVGWDNVPEKVVIGLEDKLREELPGILNFCLAGLARVREFTAASKWPIPASMAAKVQEYQAAADTFGMFVADEVELGEEHSIPVKELYFRYSNWAKDHGHRIEPLGPVFRREAGRFKIKPLADSPMVNGHVQVTWGGCRLRSDVFVGNH